MADGAAALNLLIVEDEAFVAMLIEDALTLHGHRVIGVADTGAEALRMAEQDRPDLVLCDVRLADGDSGIAAAEVLSTRGIPSLFLSGNCPVAARGTLILGCLRKPFHTASIGTAVNAAYAVAQGQCPADVPPGMTFYKGHAPDELASSA